MRKKIRKAVIPVAGLGMRFMPFARAVPKEMIPIVDTPVIAHVVNEARQAGIEQIILITSKHKVAIENYFDSLDETQDTDFLIIRQVQPLGLGHAVACARQAIGDEPFAVLLADDLIDAKEPCLSQLMHIYYQHQATVLGLMQVNLEDVSKYGIVKSHALESNIVSIEALQEKPVLSEALSRLAICGRYILTSEIFTCLEATQSGKLGEIQLTDALKMVLQKEPIFGCLFNGVRYDIGDRLGWLDANIAYALKRSELKDSFSSILKKYC
jgi:UTP--glucose-1-phosphate uridylyltransferase